MTSRDQILSKISSIIEDLFEVPANEVRLESKLADDLDLDSIDAVDLIVQLESLIGRRVEPAQFKGVRTVGDVVLVVEKILLESPIAVNGN